VKAEAQKFVVISLGVQGLITEHIANNVQVIEENATH